MDRIHIEEARMGVGGVKTSSYYIRYYVAVILEGADEFTLDRDPDNNMNPRCWTSFRDALPWAEEVDGIVIAKEVTYGHPTGITLNSDDLSELLS